MNGATKVHIILLWYFYVYTHIGYYVINIVMTVIEDGYPGV